MTAEDFNKKYNKYLETGFYGLAIDNEEVVKYLDDIFENVLTKLPYFRYQQIKTKFDNVRFYADVDSMYLLRTIENEISRILKQSAE